MRTDELQRLCIGPDRGVVLQSMVDGVDGYCEEAVLWEYPEQHMEELSPTQMAASPTTPAAMVERVLTEVAARRAARQQFQEQSLSLVAALEAATEASQKLAVSEDAATIAVRYITTCGKRQILLIAQLLHSMDNQNMTLSEFQALMLAHHANENPQVQSLLAVLTGGLE